MELKKNENRDLRKFRTLFRNVGLVITLVLTITAFEWKWEEVRIIIPEKEIGEIIDVIDIKNTTQELPPAPEPPKPESKVILSSPIIETINTDPINKKTDDFTPSDEDLIDVFTSSAPPEEKIDVTIYDDFKVEEKAMPTDSFAAWYKRVATHCGNNLRERDKMYKGKVWLSFVIEKDGTLSNIEVIQSVHKRVDALAINALKNSGDWKPAKMGARNVRQRMRVPISFK